MGSANPTSTVQPRSFWLHRVHDAIFRVTPTSVTTVSGGNVSTSIARSASEEDLVIIASTAADSSVPPEPKACGHAAGCQLITREGCCACLDRRPVDPSGYMHYIDGQGWQSGHPREATYCPYCRIYPVRPLLPARMDMRETRHALSADGISIMPSLHRKSCGHDYCHLSLSLCCSCSDRRPHMASYEAYIDGRGVTSDGTRSQFYCSPCRERAEPLATTATAIQDPFPYEEPIALPETPSVLLVKPESRSPPPSYHVGAPSSICKICFDAPADVLFLPCAHIVSCTVCAALIMSGPSISYSEISGNVLASQLPRGGRSGEVRPEALTRVRPRRGTSGNKPNCPVCRSPVSKWIKVYHA